MSLCQRVRNLLLAGLLAGCASTPVLGAEKGSVASTGLVRFAQKMDGPQQPGGRQCSVAVDAIGSRPKQTKMSDAGCGNDVATFFKLEDVPSSTIVGLSSEKKCWGGDWWFSVRAAKHPTSSIWIDIRDLRNKKQGDIVAPGVVVWQSDYSNGNIEGKLSCAVLYMPDK